MTKINKKSRHSALKRSAKPKACKKAKVVVKTSKKAINLAKCKAKIKISIRKSKAKTPDKKAQKKISAAEIALAMKKKELELQLKQLHDTLSQAHARRLLIDTGGENALAIVRSFSDNISDEEIAKRLKLRISDVRATLNRLHNEGLVNYMRERDSESGWYSYTWTLNKDRIHKWIEENSKDISNEFENKGDHYFCPSCGSESITPFESAVEYNFRCAKCSRSLEFLDVAKMDGFFSKERK